MRSFEARQADEAIELTQQALAALRGDFLCQVTGADWATCDATGSERASSS